MTDSDRPKCRGCEKPATIEYDYGPTFYTCDEHRLEGDFYGAVRRVAINSDRPMVSAPLSAKGTPCPDCGRPWDSGRHCVRAIPGTICGVDGCRRKPLTECLDEAGVRVASVCVIGGKHRWRNTQ